MKQAIAVLAILSMVAFAGQVRVDLPVGSGGYDADVLQYDDGSANWLTWAGTYRGTWFCNDDFVPNTTGFALAELEYWFYAHASYPWDTSQFYSEAWNGDDLGPMVQLAQGIVTAVHYSPVYHTFSPALECEKDFWGLVNTEMSAGGWPSILADGTGYGTWPPVCHSFFSDDFIVWEEWSAPAPDPYGDFFVRAEGDFLADLNATTWGAVKALF